MSALEARAPPFKQERKTHSSSCSCSSPQRSQTPVPVPAVGELPLHPSQGRETAAGQHLHRPSTEQPQQIMKVLVRERIAVNTGKQERFNLFHQVPKKQLPPSGGLCPSNSSFPCHCLLQTDQTGCSAVRAEGVEDPPEEGRKNSITSSPRHLKSAGCQVPAAAGCAAGESDGQGGRQAALLGALPPAAPRWRGEKVVSGLRRKVKLRWRWKFYKQVEDTRPESSVLSRLRRNATAAPSLSPAVHQGLGRGPLEEGSVMRCRRKSIRAESRAIAAGPPRAETLYSHTYGTAIFSQSYPVKSGLFPVRDT